MDEIEVEMSLSNEDLAVLALGFLGFAFSFADVRSETSIAMFAFPIIVIFLICWGFVRFRRRPLPKQIQYSRYIFLGHIKTLRNYNLLAIIFHNLLILTQYISLEITYQNNNARLALVYNYVCLFVFTVVEFAGHITSSDVYEVFPKMKDEDESAYRKKRFEILFGTKFWIWIVITSLISIGLMYLPFAAIILTGDVFLIVSQVILVIFGLGIVLYFYYRVVSFEKLETADMVIKAANYYNDVELKEESYELLEEYTKSKGENIVIMSKLALMYTQDSKYDRVLELTEKVLAETEGKEVNIPHMIARAHLLRSISLKAKEQYEDAYKEVTQTLKYTPENNAARKLRRDLRKILKIQKQEKK